MSSTTTNLGLYKPAAGENVSVTTDLNNNWDTIDSNWGTQFGAWTDISTTVGFSNWGAVTVQRFKYKKFGKTVKVQGHWTIPGAQTGGTLSISLPAGQGLDQHAGYSASGARDLIGFAQATDASAGQTYLAYVYFSAARTIIFRTHGQADVWGSAGSLPFLMANTDSASVSFEYELA